MASSARLFCPAIVARHLPPRAASPSVPRGVALLPARSLSFPRAHAPPSRALPLLFHARAFSSQYKSPPRELCLGAAAAAASISLAKPPRRRSPRASPQRSPRAATGRSPAKPPRRRTMFRPPRPRAELDTNSGEWPCLPRQVPHGFEEGDASRSDGLEFGDDLSQDDMRSGSYFANLLGANVHDPPIDHGDHGTAAATKGSQERTKNFSEDEDKLLLSAWLNVSMDPIRGVDQSQASYWTRIHAYFQANKSIHSDRSQGSLMNRWSTILHDVNLFCGCVTRIQDRNQSGCSVDDKIAAASTLWTTEDKKHRKFTLIHCWRILKDKPKWIEKRKQLAASTGAGNKKQKTKTNSSPSSAAVVPVPGSGGVDAAVAEEDPSKRPDGKKTEKKKLRQRSSIEAMDYLVAKLKETDDAKEIKKEQMCNKVIALQEEKIKLEREKFEKKAKLEREQFEFQRDLEEERILTLDLSNMTYRLRQYYEGRQEEILARRGC